MSREGESNRAKVGVKSQDGLIHAQFEVSADMTLSSSSETMTESAEDKVREGQAVNMHSFQCERGEVDVVEAKYDIFHGSWKMWKAALVVMVASAACSCG